MPKTIKIALLGSTGSIGTQTLDVVRHLAGRVKIVALSAGRNVELLSRQIEEFSPRVVGVANCEDVDKISARFPDIQVLCGDEALKKIPKLDDVDVVVNAVVGSAGLLPSWYAVVAGKRLCTANKESLVMAGEILMREAKSRGAEIFPIDSEHSALFQAMFSGKKSEIRRLILTASGGPFWNYSGPLDEITPQQALAHPTWSMGAKITIDSATLMNKGLELIEAHYLFDIPPEQIDVLIHPQSIVHSIVEFVDGAQIAQMSYPDMRLPIQYALTYPERLPSPIRYLDLFDVGKLEFYRYNPDRFPAIEVARRALNMGGNATIFLNVVNELAVLAFLEGKIKFTDITKLVIKSLDELGNNFQEVLSITDVLAAEKEARRWWAEKIT